MYASKIRGVYLKSSFWRYFIKEFLEFILKLMQRTNQLWVQLKKITEFLQATLKHLFFKYVFFSKNPISHTLVTLKQWNLCLRIQGGCVNDLSILTHEFCGKNPDTDYLCAVLSYWFTYIKSTNNWSVFSFYINQNITCNRYDFIMSVQAYGFTKYIINSPHI